MVPLPLGLSHQICSVYYGMDGASLKRYFEKKKQWLFMHLPNNDMLVEVKGNQRLGQDIKFCGSFVHISGPFY